jgi:hypothetical protein
MIRGTDELCNGKDLRGSGCNSIETLSQNLPRGSEENHDKHQNSLCPG